MNNTAHCGAFIKGTAYSYDGHDEVADMQIATARVRCGEADDQASGAAWLCETCFSAAMSRQAWADRETRLYPFERTHDAWEDGE